MGSSANKRRKKWQDYSGKNANSTEKKFFEIFEELFNNKFSNTYRIRRRPDEFSKIYIEVELSKKDLLEIYTPKEPIIRHGVFPDYAIDNLKTKKTIYVEVKRQDGWVEGKKRSDGRGNAHERSCKFFTPGLLKKLHEKSNLNKDVLPFWTVFHGDITRDPCRVREITLWYDTYKSHYFFWRNSDNPESLIKHFEEKIKPLLE
jgi:hypothetical protein